MRASGFRTQAAEVRQSGLQAVGDIPWGTHICQFYQGRQDLLDTLIPFFKLGLESNERCLWITAEPLVAADARASLRAVVADLDARIERGQIEILDYSDWYLHFGDLVPSTVLKSWMERESEALADGYQGLRLSGNTFWLDSKDWASFAEYEANVHEAFHSRRIVALCSYALDKCGSDDIIDVLRNHRFALVRRKAGWETIQSATVMLHAVEREPETAANEGADCGCAPASNHGVRFFNEHEYPAPVIAQYLESALDRGGAAIAFATPEHAEQIVDGLELLGVNTQDKIANGELVLRDARAVAAMLFEGTTGHRALFDEHVIRVVDRVLAQHRPIRAYGEIVDVLAHGQNPSNALVIEGWWNELLRSRAVELLCGYATDRFADAGSVSLFRQVCGEHSDVRPAVEGDRSDHGRIVAELEQAIAALRCEARRRHEIQLEHDRLREAERAARLRAQTATEHLARLQQFTSALSEAVTPSDIGSSAVAELEQALQADRAVVALSVDEGQRLALLGQVNVNAEQSAPYASFPADAPLPLAAAFRTGRPIWLLTRDDIERHFPLALQEVPDAHAIICVPLALGGRRMGAMGLSFTGARDPQTLEKALIEDYAKQVAVALDRACSFDEAQRARNRLQLLVDVSCRVAQARLDLQEVVGTIVREVTSSGFADTCAINLRSREEATLPLAAVHHADPELLAHAEATLRGPPVGLGQGIIGGVAQTGEPVRISTNEEILRRAQARHYAHLTEYPVSSLIVVPLRSSGEVIGTVTAARYDPSAVFAPDDQQLLQDLADRASLSIQNALLYERAQRERERAEQERERAEDANRAKDEFLAMLGHELRNPLSPILTALQLMRLRAGDMLGKERTIIERQVSYMVRLVDDLLDVSRITRGKVQLERRPTQLAEVVACAIEIASPVLEERAHKLVVSVPGLTVQADANRLAQVIANLLTNAAKYTAAQGLIEVSATVLDGSVALSVKDNGVGIEPGLLPRIFELFVQGTQSSDRAQGGLGLGLAIAKTLVEMHGGKLTASSEGLGKGSEFIVELPVIGALTSVAPRPTEAPVQPSVRGGSRKILVVDDNLDAATVLGEVLEMVGHRVSIAHDGPSALEVAEVFRPEVCLLDIGLPVMDGYELARRLVEMLGGDLKLIAITGYGQESDRQRSAESGFHEHLVKPIEFDRLQSVIEELFLENYRPAAAQ